jgi:hypothetical protein
MTNLYATTTNGEGGSRGGHGWFPITHDELLTFFWCANAYIIEEST